jgi:uncharacterized damage-inducible protein DinB
MVLNQIEEGKRMEELIARFSKGNEKFLQAIEGVGEEEFLFKPAPGKWCIKEVVMHLCDIEIVFAFRIKSTISETNPLVFPIDPDGWANNLDYINQDHRAALEMQRIIRANTVAVLRKLPAEAWDRTVVHRATGKMTLRQLVEMFANHDDRHIGQIDRAKQAYAEQR